MRAATVAVVLIAAASGVALAQSPPKAIILSDWERTRTNLLAYVDAAPDSMLGYRPTPGVRTFAQQVQHIIDSDMDAAAVVRGIQGPPVLGDTAQYLHHKAALHKYVSDTYGYVITSISEATPAQLAHVSSMYQQPAAPAWRWLQLAHEHSIWTFGQLVPYLRLNGVTPPSYNMPF